MTSRYSQATSRSHSVWMLRWRSRWCAKTILIGGTIVVGAVRALLRSVLVHCCTKSFDIMVSTHIWRCHAHLWVLTRVVIYRLVIAVQVQAIITLSRRGGVVMWVLIGSIGVRWLQRIERCHVVLYQILEASLKHLSTVWKRRREGHSCTNCENGVKEFWKEFDWRRV
jgi:hypothetical protein